MKGESLCHVEMEQGLLVKGPAQAVVWVEARARVEAGWAGRLPQGRAEIAFALNAEQPLPMLPDSLVMR